MTTDDPIDKGKSAIVGELVKEVSDSPKIREAGSQLAQAALTVSKTINVCLLPLAAINFGYEKARQYYAEKFQQDLTEKTANIPPEDIVEPKASIVGPALQGLSFSCEEESLKDMYLGLIASAIDGRKSSEVHPAFVEIIRQMTCVEAEHLQKLLRNEALPIVATRIDRSSKGSYRHGGRHILNYTNLDNGTPIEIGQRVAMVENWIRLGLVTVDYTEFYADDSVYSWAESRPEVVQDKATCAEDEKLIILRGLIVRTAFGAHFAKVVGIIPPVV